MNQTRAMYERALHRIPGGSQLLSKRPELFLPGYWPSHFARARGVEVEDLDGNVFIDVALHSVGTCPLGYADPDVNAAVLEVIGAGNIATPNSPEEVELGDLLCSIHPWADSVRYARTGGEAMAIAVRIARAHTRRERVVFSGYHGWHDWYVAANLTDDAALDGHLLPRVPTRGVPSSLSGSVVPFAFGDRQSFDEAMVDDLSVAAIVMEVARYEELPEAFLRHVRQTADRSGAVLIFDEITTGFRLCIGGAHLRLGVAPDIAVFAKGMSNGFPMAAVLGSREVMGAAVESFISSTYWTERTGPAAALATIRKLMATDTPKHLSERGDQMRAGWQSLAEAHGLEIEIRGVAALPRFAFGGEQALTLASLHTQHMLDDGYLACGAFYPSLAHEVDHVAGALEATDRSFRRLAAELERGEVGRSLRGAPAQSGFRASSVESPREDVETVDAVVVGGNLRGLVTAYVLGQLGYRVVLVERAAEVGGADGSFVTPGGAIFDFGMHVLDEGRSELATRLFTHVMNGRVHRARLKRAIVLRNHLIPYSPTLDELPAEIRDLLPDSVRAGGAIVDSLGSPPSRDQLAETYGAGFADLIFDEVLPSYRCEARHLEFGVDPARLLTNIYPWFFPRADRTSNAPNESRRFHDRLRAGTPQYTLYPAEGGFREYARAFVRALTSLGVEVITGARDSRLDVDVQTHRVNELSAGGRRFRAERYFWAGPWAALCGVLDVPCQDVLTDRILLGSFVLDRPVESPFSEILVGDPRHSLDRVHFPGRFRGTEDPLIQVEFATPLASNPSLDAEHWQAVWLESLRRLGALEHHRVVEFDFRSVKLHFNGFGAEGKVLVDADPSLLRAGTNVFPVVPSMANLNINRVVPRVVQQLGELLS